MRPSFRAGLLLAVLTVLIPSTASADSTVPPGGSIQTAVTNAGPGETITIQGAHTEDVTVDKQLTLVGVDNAMLTGSLSSSAAGVVVKTLSITTTAGTPVSTTGSGGLTLANLLVQRTGGSGDTPLISAAGEAGLTLRDVLGVNAAGPVVAQSGGEALIQRATLATTQASADAIAVTAGASKLTMDSTIAIGGTSGAGVRVTNTAPATAISPPAAITVALRHATVTASKGVVLDATQSLAQLAGPITAAVTSSIVRDAASAHGGTATVPLISADSPVTLTFDHSDSPPVTDKSDATVTDAGQYTADSTKLFGSVLRLRADSPAIDKGAPPAADESPTDVDGQPRVNGGASDIGADEFVNSPPKAGLTVSKADPIQGEAVTFTSAATDPDAGDAITQYYWDFGDGTAGVATDQPSVSHAYASTGTFTAKMAVKDKAGAFSGVASATISVKDGSAPVVKITTPTDKSKLRLNPKGKKRKKGHKRPKPPKPLPMTVLGTVSDATGVQTVQLAITYRKTATAKSCKQYSGKKFVKAPCTKYTWVKARINGSGWQLVTKKGLRLLPGRYELRARATDTNGLTGGPIFSATTRSLVRVSVK